MSSRSKARRYDVAWVILIVAVATLAGMIVQWRAPGLSLYARDWLTRSRGELAEPDDIVIVAIDDESIAKLGRFPWPREYSARLLDSISAAHPKAISLDVLFTEPSDQTADDLLAAAIKNAGNVVIPAQLTEQRDAPETSRSKWLEPLPSIGASAAGIGHVNVETESDGGARELLLKLSDDNGDGRWALAIETIRVGDNLNSDDITESAKYVRLGTRKIPFISAEWNIFLKNQDADSRFSIATPLRMNIDYIGPTGSYAAQTYSFSDVLDGKISPDKFRNKYVLIGATAATLGDRIATPYVHTESADGDQHGDLMPGVEILANTINTILRGRFYQPVSDCRVCQWYIKNKLCWLQISLLKNDSSKTNWRIGKSTISIRCRAASFHSS